MELADAGTTHFHPPRLAGFRDALAFIRAFDATDRTVLLALDQPTIVHNATGCRPVERLAASIVSWLGGGVQPASRSRIGMFCDASPIWPFLRELDAAEDPEIARTATTGLHLCEVFPALGLASLTPEFFGLRKAAKYNPQRRTFKLADWNAVAATAADSFCRFGSDEAGQWCRDIVGRKPAKADQDRLDAMLCLLIAMTWRLRPRTESMLLGDLASGYIVVPASSEMKKRIEQRAAFYGISAV